MYESHDPSRAVFEQWFAKIEYVFRELCVVGNGSNATVQSNPIQDFIFLKRSLGTSNPFQNTDSDSALCIQVVLHFLQDAFVSGD